MYLRDRDNEWSEDEDKFNSDDSLYTYLSCHSMSPTPMLTMNLLIGNRNTHDDFRGEGSGYTATQPTIEYTFDALYPKGEQSAGDSPQREDAH